MDAARLQDTINRSLGTAARAIGVVCDAHRPAGPGDPVCSGNRFLRINAAFNARDSRFRTAALPSDPVWYGVFDASYLNAGDYLVEQQSGRVWFVGGMPSLLPALCVLTNAVVSLTRPGSARTPGLNAYGAADTSMPVIAGFPASLLPSGAVRSPEPLPADTRPPDAVVLLPPLPTLRGQPIVPSRGDLMTDSMGRHFVVSLAEANAMGWRLAVRQASS